MAWLVIHRRDRALLVSNATAGRAVFTRGPELALAFKNQAAARSWLARQVTIDPDELALWRDRRRPTQSPKTKSPDEGSPGLKSGKQHGKNTPIPNAASA